MKNFHLTLGEPRIVVQGPPEDHAWGHYQFPSLSHSKGGGILAYWSYASDTIEYTRHEGGIKPPFISKDGGRTWGPNTDGDSAVPRVVLPDGKIFQGFVGAPAHPMPEEFWNRLTPSVTWGKGYALYFAEDLGKTEETAVRARIFDPATGETETYEAKILWPHAPIVRHPGNMLFPMTQVFALGGSSILEKDGALYMCLYVYGFDSAAESREMARGPYNRYYSTYLFASKDGARTWEYLSQISVDDSTFDSAPGFEGFGEPMMEIMPDGSFVMLMRTGSGHSSYITRSADHCRSWSRPTVFDDIGVRPYLLRLGCGVTLATYGRPYLRIRATADPAGLTWQDPITVDVTGTDQPSHYDRSCFYAKLLPLDDTTALWIYSDFQNPNGDGKPAKTILVRTVTVTED